MLSLVAGACAGPEAPSARLVESDSAGTRITVVPEALLAAAPEWSLDARPLLSLGDEGSGERSQFFRISGVHMRPDGGVLVATDASKQLITFDANGATTRIIGRQGRGPLEFLHLQMIGSADSNAVPLFDALQRRVTVLCDVDSAVVTISLATLGIGPVLPQARFSNGDLLLRKPGPLPEPTSEGVVRGVDSLVRVGANGEIVSEFGGHPADERVLRLNANGGLTGGQPPYRRRLLVAAADSMVVVATTGSWEFRVFPTDGRTTRIVRLSHPRRAVDAEMRLRFRERVLRDVRDPYGVREWTMLSADDVFPRDLPAFDLMLFDREGALWLRESVVLADTDARWIVVDGDGTPLARVRMPADFTPTDIGRDRIAGVWTDTLGGEQVRVYRVRR